ncbi:MAG: autotransporter outer membrane beta-barrel domain-containing protein [Gammaproteobacteria bacterium]|nr:autotransporter outer membrane beta-barrel domain-containing protein [Gammaproteobacteria bacterium]
MSQDRILYARSTLLGRAVATALLATVSGTAAAQLVSYAGSTSPIEGRLQDQNVSPSGFQRALGELIEDICPSRAGDSQLLASDDLTIRCTEIVVQGVSAKNEAGAGLAGMAPEEVGAVATIQVDADQDQVASVRGRQASLRSGAARTSSLQMNIDGKSYALGQDVAGSGLGAGNGRSGVGIFLNGNAASGDKERTFNETAFDFHTFSVTGGIDYQFTPSFVLGAAVGYTYNKAEIEQKSGDIETDGLSFFGYASFYPTDNIYIDALFGYTVTDFDQERAIRYNITALNNTSVTSVDNRALSSTDGDEISGSLQLGYDWFSGGWNYGAYGRVQYARTEIDSFRERIANPNAAGSGLALAIDKQTFTSVPAAIGLQIGKTFYTSWGEVYPQVFGEYTHEFSNNDKALTGQFVNDPTNTKFALPSDEPDRDYVVYGARATALFGGGQSVYAMYQGLAGYSDLTLHAVEVGVRVDF